MFLYSNEKSPLPQSRIEDKTWITADVSCASALPPPDLSLRLGSIAPNFKADTTKGPIDFHEFIGDNWVILFSHPEDFTPVCTTELGAFARLEPKFNERGAKLIGLSANTLGSHEGWIKDIDEVTGSHVNFPIIADKERKVAYLYDMYVPRLVVKNACNR